MIHKRKHFVLQYKVAFLLLGGIPPKTTEERKGENSGSSPGLLYIIFMNFGEKIRDSI